MISSIGSDGSHCQAPPRIIGHERPRVGHCGHRRRRRGADGRHPRRRTGSPRPSAGEESPARRQDPHVRRHALQHHPRHRQPRHRRGLRSARALPALRPGRLQRAGHHRLLRGGRRRRPRSRRPARSSPSATRPPTCSTPCCAACTAAAPPWPWASRSSTWSGARPASRLTTPHAHRQRRPRHPDDGRPVVPRQRHDRRRLPPRREVRPHHRAAAAGPGADHRRASPGWPSCAASRCPTSAVRVLEETQVAGRAARLAAVRPFRPVRPGRSST